jgi:hypothetical protein
MKCKASCIYIANRNWISFYTKGVICQQNHAEGKIILGNTHLGRIVGISSVIKEAMLQSKQMGRRENKIINIEGRVQFDLLQVNRL